MVRWTTIGLWLGISAAFAGCGDDDTDPMNDAGTEEDSGTGVDAGQDAGTRPDSGPRDAGVACTSGCAIEEVVVGVDHACGRRENGEVLCWGGNGRGQLGDGRERGHGDCATRGVDDASGYDCSARPVIVSDVTATGLASNAAFQTCALSDEGPACWGLEDVAATGSDTRRERFTAEVIEGYSPAAELQASTNQLCARLTNGTAVCRGENESGELLQEGDEPRRMVGPLPGLTDLVELDYGVGGSFACGRTATSLACWGNNQDGQLGDGLTDHGTTCGVAPETYDCSREPVEVAGLDAADVVQVDLGSRFACALLSDGTVWCWGANAAGQLGSGTTEAVAAPQQVPGLTGVSQISLGSLTACALLSSGEVRCWGSNEEGQVGDGEDIGSHDSCDIGTTVDCVLTPTAVALPEEASAVSMGIQTGCAIGESGAVFCWGSNFRMQLGQTDRERRATPVAIEGLD